MTPRYHYYESRLIKGFLALQATEQEILRRAACYPDLLAAALDALAIVTDTRIGTWSYMEGSDIYDDLRRAKEILSVAIDKAQAR